MKTATTLSRSRVVPRDPTAGVLLVMVALSLLGNTAAAAAQQTPRPVAARLPPLLMTCPHHPDVVEERPGSCPLCKMALVPVRIDAAWICPVHAVVSESSRGACRLCGRVLVQAAVSLTWVCRGDGSEHLEPGLCANGIPRLMRRALRPHGNHNPQHGGQFFMAPDNWHHIEGAHPGPRVFRLYLYDDFSRTLEPSRLKAVRGRVVTRETYDTTTRVTRELAAFSLTLSRTGDYLEARIDPQRLPADMTAKVRFAKDAPEYRFDFTFDGLSSAPVETVARRAVTPAPPVVGRPAGMPSQATRPAPVAPGREGDAPPSSLPAVMSEMRLRLAQTGELIRRGEFSTVWIPALAVKDLAIALEPHLDLAPTTRRIVEASVADVVRVAWQLDALADTGDRPRIDEAYGVLTRAVERVSEGLRDGVAP